MTVKTSFNTFTESHQGRRVLKNYIPGAPYSQADQVNLGNLSNPAGKRNYDKHNTQFLTVMPHREL